MEAPVPRFRFLDTGEFDPDESRDEKWNRGAYLAEGLGHCGACHTPRNVFGALIEEAAYDGADVEEWHAPALNTRSPAPIPWSQEQLVDYLFDGWEEEHGIAAGPMAPVVNHLYDQSEGDIFAIAAYLESRQRPQLTNAERETVLAGARSLDWERDPDWRPERTQDDPSLRHGMEAGTTSARAAPSATRPPSRESRTRATSAPRCTASQAAARRANCGSALSTPSASTPKP